MRDGESIQKDREERERDVTLRNRTQVTQNTQTKEQNEGWRKQTKEEIRERDVTLRKRTQVTQKHTNEIAE